MGLDIVEIILATEDRFKVSITDSEASKISTVGQLHQLILSKIEPSSFSDKQVWDELCSILYEQVSIPKEKIFPESRFVADLGIE